MTFRSILRGSKMVAGLQVGALAALLTAGLPANPDRPQGTVHGAGARSAVAGSYLVRLEDTVAQGKGGIPARAHALVDKYDANLGSVYQRTLPGFAATMTPEHAAELAADPDVKTVTQNQLRSAANPTRTPAAGPIATPAPNAAQAPAPWGLDRIDQKALPLDNQYAYDDTAGSGVDVYVVASGIQASVSDFGDRVVGGINVVGDGRSSTSDCTGLGTRLAGIVGGTQYGVAKRATLVSVRAVACDGVFDEEDMLDAFEWILNNASGPSVLLLPFADTCFDRSTGQEVACPPEVTSANTAAQEGVFAAGIPVINAAGDSGIDTCTRSDGAAPHTIHVGATTITDARAANSNFGPCVTMFAPGAEIPTDRPDGGQDLVSFTSFAAAAVAGTAALFMGKEEFAGASPTQVRNELVTHRSTPNVITNVGTGSPNLLLYTGPPGFFTVEDDPLTMGSGGDGSLDAFGADQSNHLVRRTQDPTTGAWGAGTPSATRGWKGAGLGTNADGRAVLVGVDTSGGAWVRRETAANNNTWTNWVRLSPTSTNRPITRVALGRNHSNRTQIFASDTDGQLFYRSQLSVGSTTFSAWTRLGDDTRQRSLNAVLNADGRIELITLDPAGRVWRRAQTSPTDTNWSTPTQLTGSSMATIAAAGNANGVLTIIGLDAGGNLWQRQQTSAGAATWTGWTAFTPRRTLTRIAASTMAGGRIQLVGVDGVGRIWQSTQTAPNAATYSAWTQIPGELRR